MRWHVKDSDITVLMKMNIVEKNSINNVPQWKPRVHLMVKVGYEMTQSNILNLFEFCTM